jgi:hypothetical protein
MYRDRDASNSWVFSAEWLVDSTECEGLKKETGMV